MSSTAVILSGQLRSFAQTYETQRWCVYRRYEPDIHFYVSCVDDAQADSAELLRKDYEHVHIERYTDPELPPIDPVHEAHAPYANAASTKALLLQHWGNLRAWEFFNETRWSARQPVFSTIIRMRPDNFFHRFTHPGPIGREQCATAWWGRFGGINDRFAIMGSTAAIAYFRTYERINELMAMGCPFHPESLVAASLEQDGVIAIPLQAEFSTHRIAGDPRPHRPPEISASDIADLMFTR